MDTTCKILGCVSAPLDPVCIRCGSSLKNQLIRVMGVPEFLRRYPHASVEGLGYLMDSMQA